MEGWVTAGIGLASAIAGMFFGYRAFKRSERSDIANETKASAAMISDIGYIKSGIDDLKRKQERADERYLETVTRLTQVEASVKQAHKRLDELGALRSVAHEET